MSASRVYEGPVKGLGPKRVRAAVLVENYGFIVFDTKGAREVELEDFLSGIKRSHGSQTVRNQTQGRDLWIYVEAYDATPASVQELLQHG